MQIKVLPLRPLISSEGVKKNTENINSTEQIVIVCKLVAAV